MNFMELKERLASELKQLWERIEESSLYNQLRDRYENLTPSMQRLTLVGASIFFAMIILSVPWGYWEQSNTDIGSFENRRDLVRRLLKTSRDAGDAPDIPAPPPVSSIVSEIQSYLSQVPLSADQIQSVSNAGVDSSLIPSALTQGGIVVSLMKLNQRQIVDIGFKLKSLSPAVKMTAINIEPNRESPQYFNVVYKLAALAVPNVAMDSAPEEEEAPKRPLPRGKRPTKTQEDEE